MYIVKRLHYLQGCLKVMFDIKLVYQTMEFEIKKAKTDSKRTKKFIYFL